MPIEIMLLLGGFGTLFGVAGGLRHLGKKRALSSFGTLAQELGLAVSGNVANGKVGGFKCALETGMSGDAPFTTFRLHHKDLDGLRGGPVSLWAETSPLGDRAFDKVVAFEAYPPGLRSRLDGTGRDMMIEAVGAGVTISEGAVVWRSEQSMSPDKLRSRVQLVVDLAAQLWTANVAADLIRIANRDAVETVAVGAIRALIETTPEQAKEALNSDWPQVRLEAGIGAKDPHAIALIANDLSQPVARRLQALDWLVDNASIRASAVWRLVEQGVAGAECVELVARLNEALNGRQAALLAEHTAPQARIYLASALARSQLSPEARRSHLHALLEDRDGDVVGAAAQALGDCGEVADVGVLQQAASRVFLSAAVKRAVAHAIAQLQSSVDPEQAGGLAVVQAGGELSVTDD